jgi:hypothetical protein
LRLSDVVFRDGDATNTFDEAHLKYYFACVRGGLGGFMQGFYNNKTETIGKECLGETAVKHIYDFNSMLLSGDIFKIFKSVGALYQIGFDIQRYCRGNEITFDLMTYCLNKSNDCSVPKIVSNLQGSIFKLTGAANKIAEVLVDEYSSFGKEDLTKLDDAAAVYNQLGQSMGEVSRTILGFNKTMSSGGKKPKPAPQPELLFSMEE